MFGSSQPSSGAGGGGAFGSLGLGASAEQPAKRKSIFDISSAQTTQPQAQPQAQQSSFFGPASTTAASSTTMFAPSTSAGQSQGLFGAVPSTSAPASGTFSFLGGTGSQQQQQPQAPQQPQQSGLGSSIFSNAPPGQSSQQQSLGQSQSRDPAHFNSLLERQRKRQRFGASSQNGRVGQLPHLNMDLGDLARRAQEIGARGPKPALVNGADSRAHYLLAGSGVAPGKASKEFERLERDGQAPTYQPARPFDPDNEKYIRGLQERGREAMIQEAIDRVRRDFDAHLEESLSINFEEQKKKIMQHFGLIARDEVADEPDGAQPDQAGLGHTSTGQRPFEDSAKASTRSVFGRSGLAKSLIGSPAMGASTTSFFGDSSVNNGNSSSLGKGQNGRFLRDKERFFLQKVQQLNAARLQEKLYPILREFAMVEDQAGGDIPRQLVDAYDALIDITKEDAAVQNQSDPGAIKERQYSEAYLDEKPHSPKATKLRKQILHGSRAYLEKAFYREVESVIEKNPREAQLGGRPTLMNKIRAYIRVRASRKDLAPDGTELQQIGDHGDYCWIIIFYLLRCGFVRQAVEYVSNDPAFQSTDRKFISYLTNYASSPERRLSRKLQDMINGEYQQRLRNAPENTLDPYRMACYKMVGRCDLNRRNLDTIGQGVEDWIWLQFNLAREVDRAEEISGETFGLEQICETVQEIGQKHFQKGQAEASGGYGIYFFMQMLAGMFEAAVAYLHSHNPVSAVHVAIALSYYGLLRVSDHSVAGNELLTRTTTDQAQINFVPLVAYYTASFRTALPVAAVDYLVLICLHSDLPAGLGATQTIACHECLRQLCLETREFAQLLGDIRTDGSRIPGAIERQGRLIKLDSHGDFLNAVTMQAAAIADERCQVADAVLLYHLCEDYDNVVRILNSALADAVTLDLGEAQMQLQPLKPRSEQPSGANGNTESSDPASSLSLTQSTNSPQKLAQNMISLYNSNALYYNRISPHNRTSCALLLRLLTARAYLESNPPRFMEALDELHSTNLLPLRAEGSIPVIRASAAQLAGLPQVLVRCAGVAVVWAVGAIGGERERLMQQGGGGWEAGDCGGRDAERVKGMLSGMAKDLMVFAGLVKYKLPGRVYDMLTRAGGEVGVY
ncbi:hypothetical protein GJ744_005971 [Endocarpon pusillum]|uniref:Nuclear pore protein n=1 Tax=Endocarpon pusillum TaxID=364733 RepID=A0A8H7A6Q7_9EURO|nr:hypothetical protein GJ744_005971 [Endocarpon pusillum]